MRHAVISTTDEMVGSKLIQEHLYCYYFISLKYTLVRALPWLTCHY